MCLDVLAGYDRRLRCSRRSGLAYVCPRCAADIDGVELFQQGDAGGSKAKEVQMVLVNGVTP